MKIKTLKKDIEVTNALKGFRKANNSRQTPRNFYSWWQATLAVLTFAPERFGGPSAVCQVGKSMEDYDFTMTEKEIKSVLKSMGLKYSLVFSTLLKNAADGQGPCDIRREYSKQLPNIARFLGLSYVWGWPDKGRGSFLCFRLKDPKRARTILLSEFPEMKLLFSELLKKTRDHELLQNA